MKKILLLILLSFITTISYSNENINLTFNEDSGQYWQYISDKTMGGISNGQATLEQKDEIFFARLTGNVSTKNNGGFIQIRSRFSFDKIQNHKLKIKGIKIKVRGNNEIYHIFIRTKETQSYSDYYLASFTAKENWTLIDLPFTEFKHNFSSDLKLEDKNLKTLGIVAYGRDFVSDISISKIIFYY